MRQQTNKYQLLNQPQFIAGLLVLLINDLFLKSYFHNWVTGKLSDVAGLYIFPVFCLAFFPAYKKHVYWLTAIVFALWKSNLSQPLIDALNNVHIPFNRVIDATDLIALAVLPLSYKYGTRSGSEILKYLSPKIVGVAALFIFCNDSIVTHTMGPKSQFSYKINQQTTLTKEQFFKRLDSMGIRYYADSTVSSHFYYDTSAYALTKTIQDDKRVTYFWRIKNYVVEKSTIKNINFQFREYPSGNYFYVMGFDIDELTREEEIGIFFNNRQRKYGKLLRASLREILK